MKEKDLKPLPQSEVNEWFVEPKTCKCPKCGERFNIEIAVSEDVQTYQMLFEIGEGETVWSKVYSTVKIEDKQPKDKNEF